MKTIEIYVLPALHGLTMFAIRYRGFPRRIRAQYDAENTLKSPVATAVFYYDDCEMMTEDEEREVANMFYSNEKLECMTVDVDAKREVVLGGLVIYPLNLRN